MVPEDELMAKALAAVVLARKSMGLLHGLPFVVKDLIETKGYVQRTVRPCGKILFQHRIH
jgi:Asp-tRNA(Asn)/Glu-tRNA(Gln) amidotransferase A subunit family amidase